MPYNIYSKPDIDTLIYQEVRKVIKQVLSNDIKELKNRQDNFLMEANKIMRELIKQPQPQKEKK